MITDKPLKVFALSLLVSVVCSYSSIATAQTQVRKYMQMNGMFITFYAAEAPSRASQFTAAATGDYAVRLDWSEVRDVTAYLVEHLEPGAANWSQVYSGLQTGVTLENLSIGEHAFRLVSCGGDLCSDATSARYVDIVYAYDGDDDNDGIPNNIDECADTTSAATIDIFGCSESQIAEGGFNHGAFSSTPALVNCITLGNPPAIRQAEVCMADELTDSDQDEIADIDDPYPFQSETQCVPD